MEDGFQLNFGVVDPGTVHFQDLLDTFLDVELADVLPEFVGFDLSEIQQVLHQEGHHLSGRLVDLEAFVHLVE